jgi:hypothetical protein
MVWSGFKSPVAGSCEHGIETSDSIIGEYFWEDEQLSACKYYISWR